MFVTKDMMDRDIFYYIHEGGEWVTSPNGSTKYSGCCHESIDVNRNMFHAKFGATVYGVLDIQPFSVKINYTLHFDPSCLVPLDDDAPVSRMFRYKDRFCQVYVSTCEEIAGEPTM